jgi:FtsP/CotA-like multicopper oxidase with cupredoxin domain
MSRVSGRVSGLLLGAALFVAAGALHARAQAPAQAPAATATPAPTKSVYGKLLSVDKTRNNVLMTEDGGAQLAWHFNAPVIAEAARFKPGDPLIVIYRQTSPKEKRVTAIAFPGTAKSPIYVNMTGDRVVLRSAAGVGDRCEETTGAVSESVIPAGGLAEVLESCWCCAPAGEACTPGTRSGLGRAYLAQCFR